MKIHRYTARYLVQTGEGKCGVVLAESHDRKVRELERALQWAAQWCPTLLQGEVWPIPSKTIQRLVYRYRVPPKGLDHE
jgi:hypothetical protein